ncbi:MAG: hypothetical protein NTV21_06900 [Planctomycetota bacterium]|nr:hypothetical protein [Planctomycetota bacterium]
MAEEIARPKGPDEDAPLDDGHAARAKRRSAARIEQLLFPILAGVVHGLIARGAFGHSKAQEFLGVMTASFILLVPLTIGMLVVVLGERRGPMNLSERLTTAVFSALLALAACLALAWEGIICVFLWVPLYAALAAVGALIGGAAADWHNRNERDTRMLSLVVLLPYLVAPLERRFETRDEIRVVENVIRIEASPEAIWSQIERVPRFREEEHHFALSHVIGFPRPVEATLSHEGVCGVRHATFEGNVLFIETITHWEEPRKLTFGIHADADTIPPHTLDEHVTIGGPYFDVLEGEYELEPLADGAVLLHLRSRHRVSTHFNFYATLWTDFIMSDVQSYILEIVKRRSEALGQR